MNLFSKKLSYLTLIVCIFLLNIEIKAQTSLKISKKTKSLLGELVFVPSGKVELGKGQDFGVLKAVPQLIQGHEDFEKYQVINESAINIAEVNSFIMMSTEVTNLQWRKFYEAMKAKLGREKAKKYLPDNTAWAKDVPNVNNDPLSKYYFTHPAFEDFPVVGVSWEQAQAFCQWLTEEVNALQAKKGLAKLPAFRLPTEAEWEYAATKGQTTYSEQVLATSNGQFTDNKGKVQVNCGAVYDKNNTKIINYTDDGIAYTNAVKGYNPNAIGLYGMSGNVAEWVTDDYDSENSVKVCKGGSWITGISHLFCGSRIGVKKEAKHSFIGFRVVSSIE